MILREGKEFTIQGFQQVIDVNLTGNMRMRAAKPLLTSKGRHCQHRIHLAFSVVD
jgi:hypothetical protein